MKSPPNILVLTYWSLPDALIQTYTLPYLRMIRKRIPGESRIFLLTLEKTRSAGTEPAVKLALKKEGLDWLPEQYYPFGILAMMFWPLVILRLLIHIRKNGIQYIHCWATPAGAIGYVLSILSGAKLIIDSYEPHAEAMVENGTWKSNSLPYRILFALEKLQSKRAIHLIAANGGMRNYANDKYGLQLTNMLVKPACVDLELFHPAATKGMALLKELGLEGKIVGVYAGKLGGIYLDREVFDFLKEAHAFWGDDFRALLLTNHNEAEISAFCATSELPRSVVVARFVPHSEVPTYLGLADFALTPVKPVPTKRFCSPIKDGEYWAMGLPVVITHDISDDSEIIQMHDIGAVLARFDSESLRNAVKKIDSLLKERPGLTNRIRRIAEKHRNFELAEKVYDVIYAQAAS
jgi:glycosyltransferase involved in cell wall biosynthesis